MRRLAALFIVLCCVLILVGFHYGHQIPALLMLVPFGSLCGACGGYLLAESRRR